MRLPVRIVLLTIGLWLGCASLAWPAGSTPPADASDSRVLVMLRLPPEHFRPEATYGDSYGDAATRMGRRRVASRLAREHGLTLVGDWPMPLLGVDCFIMQVPTASSPEAEAASLARDPSVAWSEPLRLYHAQSTPAAHRDPLFPAQPAARQWRLADLHQMSTGRNISVAVIDSKVERDHPDLQGQIAWAEDYLPSRPVISEAHGTGVAGIIAARADNGVGIVGIAPRARLMALRACWQGPAIAQAPGATLCDSLSLAQALHFAIEHDAQVINLSLSGPPDRLLSQLIDIAIGRGETVVAAYDRDLPGGGFPASHAGVVAVSDEPMARPVAGVYIAPGRDVPTTQPGGRWFLVSGSSYSAAHVSGLFALLRQRSPRARMASALVVARPGEGLIDACASLIRAAGPCDCACARPSEVSAYLAPNPVTH